MQATIKQLDKIAPKIDQGVKGAASEIGNRVNKALDEFEPPKSTGIVGKPKKSVANELDAPKGNDLKGAKAGEYELDAGKKGDWNKQLNGKLEPHSKYKVGNYTYQTDEFGRIKSVKGKLDLSEADRNKYQQTKAGKTDGIKDGLPNDEGGHLIAAIFKGPGEQINYAAMDGNLNKGAWKRMENKWANALNGNPPKEVNVEIKAIYEGSTKRATAFDVSYFIDGKKKTVTLMNQAGG